MKRFSIDRFEGNIAVLIDENENKICISRDDLPSSVKEGDILIYDGEKYSIDFDDTDARKSEVKRLIDELFQ